jgi:F-type H+-transporting ATPase subunit delta
VDVRRKLIDGAFASLSPSARATLGDALDKNWDSSASLLNWVEETSVKAAWQSADSSGSINRCLDEVFTFSQMVYHNHELRSALVDRSRSVDQRQALVRSLLAPTMAEPSVDIAVAALGSHYGTIDDALSAYLTIGAELIGAQIAVVKLAQPLDSKQKKELTAELAKRMGTTIIIQEVVDPSVLGGVRVECGAEVIDSTLTSRLEAARREFS